jgi:hypothetical protein
MFHLLIAKSGKDQSIRAQDVHVESQQGSTKAYIALNLNGLDIHAIQILHSNGQFGDIPEGAKSLIFVVETLAKGDITVSSVRVFRATDQLHIVRKIVSGYISNGPPIVIGTSSVTCRDCTLVAGHLAATRQSKDSVLTGSAVSITSGEGASILDIHSAYKARDRIFIAFSFAGARVTLSSGHTINSGCTAPDNSQEYAVVRLIFGKNSTLQFEDSSCLPKRTADGSSSIRDTEVRDTCYISNS